MTPIKEAEQIEEACINFGFCWENIDQILEQIRNECHEVKEAWQHQNLPHLKEEIGDLIQAAISLAVFCNCDAEETLAQSNQKLKKRYEKVVELAKKDGHQSLHNQPYEILINYWNQAKK